MDEVKGTDGMGKEELILRNTAEFYSKEELARELQTGRRMKVYLGRAITGPLHVGHLVSLSKLLDLQKAGFEATVLLADIHAALDDLKSRWEDLDLRVEYTRKVVELAIDWKEKPRFVRGADFQLTKDYQMDIYRMSTITTVSEALHAASEVTRMKNPKVSELIYPIMQALDEQYLDVDMQLGGLDQRHILMFAREYLPKIGYRSRMEIMMPLLPSLKGPGVKMSSSIQGTNIEVTASEEKIRKVINQAYCPMFTQGPPDNPNQSLTDNPILGILKMYILPNEGAVKVEREERFGGSIEVRSGAEADELYRTGMLHPADLKAFVSAYLIKKLSGVRSYFESNHDILERLGPPFV